MEPNPSNSVPVNPTSDPIQSPSQPDSMNQLSSMSNVSQNQSGSTTNSQFSAGNLEGPVSLLSSSWELFKANWKILVAIIVAPTALMYVGQIFAMSGNPILGIVAFILIIVAVIYSIAMSPAAINTVQRLLNNDNVAAINFRGQYSFGFKYFWSIIWLMIIQALISFGSIVLFFIPGIIVGIYIGMYLFVRVLEDKKGLEVFTESYSLVKGRWVAVLGRYLFLMLIYIVGAIITSGLSFVIRSLLSIPAKSTGEAVLSIILMLALSAILSPIMMIYTYKLYVSLKATRLPNVSTIGFKKWLIAFMVIGVIAIIAIPMLIGIVLIGLRSIRNEQFPLNKPNFSGYSMDWSVGHSSSTDSVSNGTKGNGTELQNNAPAR